MKTKNSKIYLTILNEYLNGEGIDFEKHNIQKIEIPSMVSFYLRILKPETANNLVMDILYEILEIDMED